MHIPRHMNISLPTKIDLNGFFEFPTRAFEEVAYLKSISNYLAVILVAKNIKFLLPV